MNDTILESVINDLVTANLILFNEGVLDAFGHVSVRNPHNRDHFFLARNMAPGLVTKEDILEKVHPMLVHTSLVVRFHQIVQLFYQM